MTKTTGNPRRFTIPHGRWTVVPNTGLAVYQATGTSIVATDTGDDDLVLDTGGPVRVRLAEITGPWTQEKVYATALDDPAEGCQATATARWSVECDGGPADRQVVWRSSRDRTRVLERTPPMCHAHAGCEYQQAIAAGTSAEVCIEPVTAEQGSGDTNR